MDLAPSPAWGEGAKSNICVSPINIERSNMALGGIMPKQNWLLWLEHHVWR